MIFQTWDCAEVSCDWMGLPLGSICGCEGICLGWEFLFFDDEVSKLSRVYLYILEEEGLCSVRQEGG